MKSFSSTSIGRIAITLGIVAAVGLLFITLFYTLPNGMSGPFGTLNDIFVALGGVLSGLLAWGLYAAHLANAPRMSRLALTAAVLGACIVPLGSGFAIFNVTGWFLAGLTTTFGYALIGLWLLGFNYSAQSWPVFPHRLALFGIVASGGMLIGLLAVPGIIAQTDALESAPWFVLAALFVGGLGWNILYTIWCFWLGRSLLAKRLALQPSLAAVPSRATKLV